MKTTLIKYEDKVSALVHARRIAKGLSDTCCLDTIRSSYESKLSVEDAALEAEMDTAYWEGDS